MIAQEIRVSGAVVSWSLTPTNRQRLRAAYGQHGFVDEVPPETSDRAALKGAMEDIKGKDQIVQALKSPSKNGYEIVNVERDEKHNHYTNNFSAWLDHGQVTTGYGYTDTERLQERFIYRKGLLAPSAVSESLKSIVLKLGAVTLYPGTYWVPDESLPAWEALATEVEQIGEGQNRLRQITTVMDEHTFREVRDAIVSEVTATATTIAEDVATGTLGDDALENRRSQATALHDRISQYEAILNETLDGLHATVENVQKATMLAMLQTVGV